MTAQALPKPLFGTPFVDEDGFLTRWGYAWISGADSRLGQRVDKVDAAHAAAMAAVPQTTQVVAGGGLQAGGALGGNVAVTLYKTRCAVAALPTSGNAEGDWAYALNGRKTGEGAGAGTGVPVWWSIVSGTGGWYAVRSGAVVAA